MNNIHGSVLRKEDVYVFSHMLREDFQQLETKNTKLSTGSWFGMKPFRQNKVDLMTGQHQE